LTKIRSDHSIVVNGVWAFTLDDIVERSYLRGVIFYVGVLAPRLPPGKGDGVPVVAWVNLSYYFESFFFLGTATRFRNDLLLRES